MALATYSDLTTAMANWLTRSDMTSRIPEFIALAESDFNRELRDVEMVVTNQNFQISGEFVPKPSGLIEIRDHWLNTSPRRVLTFMPNLAQTQLFDSTADIPKFYDVVGANIRYAPPAGGPYSSTLVYYQSIPGLQANTTNWLMTAHPNLYLAASMLWAATLLKDDDALTRWSQIYKSELDSVKRHSAMRRWGGSGMEVRSMGTVV